MMIDTDQLPALFDAYKPDALTIKLPFPPAELFPNRKNGTHWATTNKVKTKYKEDCFYLTKMQIKEHPWQDGDIRLTLVYVMPDKRHRDADNCLAASKAGLDGLADALIINDKRFQPINVYRISGEKPGSLIVQLEML
jgi:crossover junction endodeoxyribonuclease RusA